MRQFILIASVLSYSVYLWAGGGEILGGGTATNIGGGGAGQIPFQSAAGSTIFTSTFTLSGGKLGVGTSSPQTTVQVMGTSTSRAIVVNSPDPVLAATAGNTDAEIALFGSAYSATAASMLDLLSYSTNSANPLFRITNHWESSGGASSSGTISIGSYVGSTFTDVLNVTTGTTPGSAAGSVGVMTSVPKSTFDVAGNVSIGTYGGANAAPVNGLIVSGAVGIGTSSPANGTLVVQSTSTTNGNPVVNIQNNAGTSVFRVRQDGIVGIAGTPGTDPGYIFAVRAAANQIIGFGASNVADIRAVNDAGAAFQQLDIRGSTIRINPGNEGNMTLGATGGKVVIGGTTPQATLDVIGTASGDGVGVNTMTSTQVAASTPARKGVLIYNTTITALCVSTGTTVMAYSTINGTTLAVCQ